MLELHRHRDPGIFKRPPTLIRRHICARSGKIGGSGCANLIEETFVADNEPTDTCAGRVLVIENSTNISSKGRKERTTRREVMILSPQNGDIYKIDPQVSSESQRIKFTIRAGEEITKVTISIDGQPLSTEGSPYVCFWQPSPGEHTLEVMADKDPSSHRRVRFVVN